MKLLLLSLILCTNLSALDWQKDYAKAMAVENKKPTLLYFTADWCGPCKEMQKTTFKDDSVIKELAQYNIIMIDYDKNEELVKKYRVSGIPQFTLLNRFDEIVNQKSGYMSSALLKSWLKENSYLSFSDAELSKLNSTEKDLIKNFSQDSLKSMETIYSLYQKSPPAKQQALMNEMLNLQQEDLLKVLAHQLLGPRLIAANLLQLKLGEKFTYDPWANPEARKLQLESLNK
ncbi:MAG: thioredoxin family protein [Lentisphaeraceae bacterium]|nr:thioredoxin family protein [Lentisphaeraceae bacterium]